MKRIMVSLMCNIKRQVTPRPLAGYHHLMRLEVSEILMILHMDIAFGRTLLLLYRYPEIIRQVSHPTIRRILQMNLFPLVQKNS